jgi:hypothetical protein
MDVHRYYRERKRLVYGGLMRVPWGRHLSSLAPAGVIALLVRSRERSAPWPSRYLQSAKTPMSPAELRARPSSCINREEGYSETIMPQYWMVCELIYVDSQNNHNATYCCIRHIDIPYDHTFN